MNSKDEGVGVWGCGGVYVCVNGILLSHQKERNFAICQMASLVAQMVKNLPATQETQVRSLGREDPLEKGMATHSSTLAWRIPWTERGLAGHSPWGHN